MRQRYKVEGLVSLANYERLEEVISLLSWTEKEYIMDVGNGSGHNLAITMPAMTEDLEEVGIIYQVGTVSKRLFLTNVGFWIYDKLLYGGYENEI